MNNCVRFSRFWIYYRKYSTIFSLFSSKNSRTCNASFFRNVATSQCYCNSLNPKSKRRDISHVPNIKDFLSSNETAKNLLPTEEICPPYLENAKFSAPPNGKTVYFETYGCQMNVNDAEYAWAILKKGGYKRVNALDKVYPYQDLAFLMHDLLIGFCNDILIVLD